jgi:hypothetical protein
MIHRHPVWMATLCGGALLLGSPTANAESAEYIELSAGYGGPEQKNGGPGNEQPTSVWTRQGDDVVITTIYQNSDVENGYWQCKCSAVKLAPGAPPEVVADQVQLTDNGGDRPCNHPKAATDGEHIVWLYGTNSGTTNTRTYAGVLDPMCNEVDEPIRISDNGNNNEGAPDVAYVGDGFFQGSYLSTGGTDRSYARGLRLDKTAGVVDLQEEFLTGVVTPANIGRPAVVGADPAVAPNRALFCAAKGDQRPPEDGVQCAWLDTTTGDVLWKEYIAESQPSNDSYMNQPSVALLDYNQFAIMVLESSGDGKNSNDKGSTLGHLHIIQVADDGFTRLAHIDNVGAYQAHSAICSGRYGEAGERHIAAFDASITGIGQPVVQMHHFDSFANTLAPLPNAEWIINGYSGDSGYFANIYGANPNNQGRDFMRCIGDVPNPSYGMAVGFKPNVKSFFLAPHAAQKPGEPKNALFLSLVPAEVDLSEPAGPPLQGEGTTPIKHEATPQSVGDGDAHGDDAPSGNGSAVPQLPSPKAASGCTLSGSAGRAGATWSIWILALALLGARRRTEVWR